jgi:formyltetrahydrofolate deformylase
MGRPASAVLRITSPDQKGLVAAVSGLLYQHGANIVHADQHQDHEAGLFFMRVEWALDDFDLVAFRAAFADVAHRLGMTFHLNVMGESARVALFVSQHLHCYADLLHRQHFGELPCTVPLIVSNHGHGGALAAFHGIPYLHVPISSEGKARAEAEQMAALQDAEIDLIVLARYMQILSPEFVTAYPNRIINVHHSFLPAFIGARPYHAAYERGVKLIGATSHYVTATLDEGPIIEQDVVRVSHRDQVQDLIEKGRDVEKVVLSRAVRWHLDYRILCYGNKTVVFD